MSSKRQPIHHVGQPGRAPSPDMPFIAAGDQPHRGTAQFATPYTSRSGITWTGQAAWIQAAFENDTVVVVVGRDVGKTVSELFLVEDESSAIVTDHHYNFCYVAQTHSKASGRYQEWLSRWQQAGLVIAYKDKDGERWIECRPWGRNPYGWRGDFFSGEESALDNLRGDRQDRILIDEGCFIHPKAKDVLWPMALSRGGKKYITTTPKRSGIGFEWTRDQYTRAKVGTPGFVAFNAPSECSPFNLPPFKCCALSGSPHAVCSPVSYMLAQRRQFRSVSAQDEKTIEEREEFDGEFIDDMGAVFQNVVQVISLPVVRVEMNGSLHIGADPDPIAQYIIGVDWGRLDDRTVFSVFRRDTMNQVALLVFPVGSDLGEMVRQLHSLRERYRDALIVGDGREVGAYLGGYYLPRLYGDGYVDVALTYGGDNDKGAYVTRMRRLFQSITWKLLNVPIQREEFSEFSAEKMKSANGLRYSAPKGRHDDTVMAALFASIRLENRIKSFTEPVAAPSRFSYEGVKEAIRRRRIANSLSTYRLR